GDQLLYSPPHMGRETRRLRPGGAQRTTRSRRTPLYCPLRDGDRCPTPRPHSCPTWFAPLGRQGPPLGCSESPTAILESVRPSRHHRGRKEARHRQIVLGFVGWLPLAM